MLKPSYVYWISNFLLPSMKPVLKILNDRDKILFEKAMKFYFFARQQSVRELEAQLRERVSYCGSVAYSLIITYIRENNLRIEYMDFLNEEWKMLRSLETSLFNPLQIKPTEIDEVELADPTQIRFHDEDEHIDLIIRYSPGTKTAEVFPE